jgi:GrpB-like predicted nucleotidyltransferase (UPF0157 family)
VDGADRQHHLDETRVLIGGRDKRPIVITDYDPGWPQRFEAQRNRLRAALGPTAERIEHIGSTAVPGLAAKPIIDILVTVADPADELGLVAALRGAGYELRIHEACHRMFRTAEEHVHVHVWSESDPEVERYLRFRDRLRESKEDRAAYEALKRELAERDWADVNQYADAKSELIEAILSRPAGSRAG